MIIDGRGLVGDRQPGVARHSGAGTDATTGTFTPGAGHAASSSEDLDRRCSTPGDDEIGWLAQEGRVPLGYLGDAGKTGTHVPRHRRRALLRARRPGPLHAPTAIIELLGRDSVTINSGGEKIFAEEVEQALGPPPGVYDVVVRRPPERAVGPGGGGGRAAPATGVDGRPRTTLLDGVRQAHRPLQAARRRSCSCDKVVRSPGRQGRLPLGQGTGPAHALIALTR